MSLEAFHLLDNQPFDKSILKRDFLELYHQQGAQVNQSDQNIELIFGENNNYHQIGNAYLEFIIGVRKIDTTNFHTENPIGLANNAFAFCFEEARLSTTIGSDIEINKSCGQVSTIMRVISKEMVIHYLNLIILNKLTFQFSEELMTYHPQLDPHHNKKC